jgi:hypothetical protein
MTEKLLVTIISLLFLGVVVAPNINSNVVKGSNDNDLVEVTTQVCGIKGYGNTTVKLTREQYQNLEQYLVEFRARLNQTTTREEAVPIFKDAVVELDKYGLLPKGMSVEKAQGLINGNYWNSQVVDFYRKSQFLNNSNFFCLITGETTMNTRLFGLVEMGCSVLSWFLFVSSLFAHWFVDDTVFINNTISLLNSIRNAYYKINSIRLIGTGVITIGHSHPANIPPPYRYDPAVGWISTLGLLGKKSWNGSFFGDIFQIIPFGGDYTYYIGALGFLGIKLDKGYGKLFFLGSAFHVRID